MSKEEQATVEPSTAAASQAAPIQPSVNSSQNSQADRAGKAPHGDGNQLKVDTNHGRMRTRSMVRASKSPPATPEAHKTQKRNLKRRLPTDENTCEAHEQPSTSAGGGKKKKSGLKVTDQNDNLEGGSQAEILNQILAENDRLNKIVADLSKKLKDSAAANAVQAKEKENLKEANSILEKDKLRMTELEIKIARVDKEKSDMEKTLAMLQNEVASMDEVRQNNTNLEREKHELEQTLAALQVPDGSQLEDASRQVRPVLTQGVQRVNGHQNLVNCEEVENILDYKFKDQALLVEALTHTSYRSKRVMPSYERLEFLGDSVLDQIVSSELYLQRTSEGCPLSPGEMSDIRGTLVSNNTFASITVNCGLDIHMLHQSEILSSKILQFKNSDEWRHISGAYGGLLDRNSAERAAQAMALDQNGWSPRLQERMVVPEYEQIEAPKALADIFEAILGAIYLDSGMDVSLVWAKFVQLCPFIVEAIKRRPPHPVNELLDLFPPPKTNIKPAEVIKGTGKVVVEVEISPGARMHPLRFKGSGTNKKVAKTAAAKCALLELRKVAKSKQIY